MMLWDVITTCGCMFLYQVMQLLQQMTPEAVRPYAFLHSNTSTPLAVNALTFQGTGTMISGFKSSSVSKRTIFDPNVHSVYNG